jgi:hopanoid biosynthesis associated protein HpnK
MAHINGILTAASLMVGAPATADAVARARRLPGLKVGLHLALVESRPVLPPAQVPALVDADGRFRDGMLGPAIRIFFDPAARRQLAAEIEAQFQAYAATGLPLDHVDSHKHFHLHPTVGALVIDIGRKFGMKALRVPIEPSAILNSIEKQSRSLDVVVAGRQAMGLQKKARRHHLMAADRVFGLAWSGAMTEARVAALLEQLPDGVTELYTHPATAGLFAGAAPGYRYADELAALTSPRVVAVAKRGDIRLIGYSDLAAEAA